MAMIELKKCLLNTFYLRRLWLTIGLCFYRAVPFVEVYQNSNVSYLAITMCFSERIQDLNVNGLNFVNLHFAILAPKLSIKRKLRLNDQLTS